MASKKWLWYVSTLWTGCGKGNRSDSSGPQKIRAFGLTRGARPVKKGAVRQAVSGLAKLSSTLAQRFCAAGAMISQKS